MPQQHFFYVRMQLTAQAQQLLLDVDDTLYIIAKRLLRHFGYGQQVNAFVANPDFPIHKLQAIRVLDSKRQLRECKNPPIMSGLS